ncbi:MAG: VCBS repeat-containing protein, partial [Deltaproteobacteria bacterium]|nr:VCBS repeat-containing protein [Deltaproteobacteria bacterium]
MTVSFTDQPGNDAVADTVRGSSEAILARTDVLAPAAARPTVCIGESTTPVGVSPPSSDPETFEDPSCASECALTGACSRRDGKATLVWPAPADDGAAGSAATSYEIWVAALGIPYPGPGGTTYTSCDQIDPGDPVEQVVPGLTPAAPGQIERAAVGDVVPLYPHRSYCFVLMPYDDLGNAPQPADGVTERAVPLINYPDTVAFDPLTPVDDQAAAALYTETGATGFAFRMSNVGDLDGDGRDDFAVHRLDGNTVSLFLSRKSLVSPDVILLPPVSSAGTFGIGIAGGDFDNDGLADLAICAGTMTTTGGPASGTNAGALFLYYGIDPDGIRRDTNTTNGQLPSITPDVALLGPADARFCFAVVVAEISGSTGDDLVVATANTSNKPRVYGFLGGSRARFPSSPPNPAIIHLDLASTPSAGFTNRPELSLQRKSSQAASFPRAIVAANVDGDGVKDIAVSDQLANHDAISTCDNCGEVYVYRGGPLLSGEIAPPDQSPSSLMHVVRYV